MTVTIRQATLQDLAALQEIDRSAHQRFTEIPDLEWLAWQVLLPEEDVREYLDRGRIYIAEDDIAEEDSMSLEGNDDSDREKVTGLEKRPLGFVAAYPLDDCLYVASLFVRLDAQGQGVGTTLLEAVMGWAKEVSGGRVTLQTFVDVPWNRPWYERRGFRVVDVAGLGEEHVKNWEEAKESWERDAKGWSRCVMLREG